MEGAVVPEVLFEFAIHRSVPKIFAIKVESCQKWRQILDVFTPSQILGGMTPKSYTHFITPASRHIARKNSCEDIPRSPKVIRAHMLNFRPHFKFSALNFFKGTPIPDVVCASKSWSICNACKKIEGQPPP